MKKRTVLALSVSAVALASTAFEIHRKYGEDFSKKVGLKVFEKMIAFLPGNRREYDISSVMPDVNSPLNGKKIIFLGSSVTYGAAACGLSFADYLKKRDGIISIKEAVSGTTLVTKDEESYIPRMKTIDPSFDADLFLCQLSTNDATLKMPLGEISASMDMNDFDTGTIAGAIEYIIAYAKETWNCPVIFYSNPSYENKEYQDMVHLLEEIQKKWQIGIIDLYNDPIINEITEKQRKLYMLDAIHPTKAGYLKLWLPVFEKELIKVLA